MTLVILKYFLLNGACTKLFSKDPALPLRTSVRFIEADPILSPGEVNKIYSDSKLPVVDL